MAIGVAIVVAVALLVKLSGGSPYAVTAGGTKVKDPGAVLKKGEAVMTETAQNKNGVLDPGSSRCYFSKLAGAHEVNTSLACGPVLFVDSSTNTQWITINFIVDHATGVASLSGDPTPNQSLAPNETLSRPDGAQPPKKLAIAVPEPPAQVAGYTTMLAVDDERGLAMRDTTDGRFLAPDYQLKLSRTLQTTKIGHGPDALIAAKGEHFVVAQFERQTSGSADSSNADGSAPGAAGTSESGPHATLIIGGTRSQFADFGAVIAAGRIVVVSVKDGTNEVLLEASDRGMPQTISLVTGARQADAIATYYRPKRSQYLGVDYADSTVVNGDSFAVSATVDRAFLAPWMPDAGAGWAHAGHTWLVVHFASWADPSCSFPCRVGSIEQARSFGVLVPGRAAIKAHPNVTSDVYFDVPDSITTATVGIHPVYAMEDYAGNAWAPQVMPHTRFLKLNFGPTH